MLVVDLSESEEPPRRELANDQRGYGVVIGGTTTHGQIYRLRMFWSASSPSQRQWSFELRLADGRWYAGSMVTYLGATVGVA